MQAKGGITIHTTGDAVRILERANERGEDYIRLTPEDIQDILDSFDEVRFRTDTVTHGGTTSFDYVKGIPELMADDIVATAFTRSRAAERVALVTDEIVGDTSDCNVLIVGESPSDHILRLPFAPRPGSAGEFLMKSLRALGASHVALANAIKSDGEPENLASLWYELGQPTLVALGRIAHDALGEAGLEHGWLQHPKFAKRMHKDTRPRYAGVLGLAILRNGDMREALTS